MAMSGGVDSSVTLIKIKEQGYNPIGITMKLWEYKHVGGNTLQDNNCCAVESINNAKLVCERLEVPHYTIDFTEDFKEHVIENFVDEYIAGRTPNPCVRCNSYVKWDTFIKQADKLGAKYIIVQPYFLAPGRHWHEHIPQLASASAANHPHTSCVVTAPLGIHSAMLQIIADRIDQSL